MTEKNHFQINRRLLKHPLWLEEPFTKGQAWVDLIGSANYADGYFYKKSQRVDVLRGQCGTSMITFAERWKWSRGKVKRFFVFLEKEGMIVQHTGHLTTLITICNYELYQLASESDGTTERTSDDTSNGHLTDIKRTSDGTHPIRINTNQKELKRKNNNSPPRTSVDIKSLTSALDGQFDDKIQGAFKDAKTKLGLSDTEIISLHSVYADKPRLAEAIQTAVEANERSILAAPGPYIKKLYHDGVTSMRTRSGIASGSKKTKEQVVAVLKEAISQPSDDEMMSFLKKTDVEIFRAVHAAAQLLFTEREKNFSIIWREYKMKTGAR